MDFTNFYVNNPTLKNASHFDNLPSDSTSSAPNSSELNQDIQKASIQLSSVHLSSVSVAVASDDYWTNYIDTLTRINSTQNPWKFDGDSNFISSGCSNYYIVSSLLALAKHNRSPLNMNKTRFVIEGQSGIGKSSSIVFFQKALMSSGYSFIYSKSVEGTTIQYYYWSPKSCGIIQENSPAFKDPKVTWFIDQTAHGPYARCRCRCVLCCSIHPNNSKFFKKERTSEVNTIGMPLPTEEDCLRVAGAYGINANELQVRRYKHGANLCAILSDPIEAENDLQQALDKCPFLPYVFQSANVDATVEIGQRIFHVDCDRTTFLPHHERIFGSDYIRDKYIMRWKALDEAALTAFLFYTSTALALGTERGKCFERYCHSNVCNGLGPMFGLMVHAVDSATEIRAKKAKKGHMMDLTHLFPSRGEEWPIFGQYPTYNNDNVDLNGRYLKPHSKTLGAIDSLVLRPSNDVIADLFQMTVDTDHGVKDNELHIHINNIDNYIYGEGAADNQKTGKIRLFIVVPINKIKEFSMQKYTVTAPQSAKITDAQLNRIEQWIICIGNPYNFENKQTEYRYKKYSAWDKTIV